VESIQHFHLLARVGARDQRITDRLDHAIAKAHEDGSRKQGLESGCQQRAHDSDRMQHERKYHAATHAEEIHDRPAHDHRNGEPPKCGHECVTELLQRQPGTGRTEYRFEPGTKCERHRGEQQRNATCCK
jgi:hypothetical protein